MCYEGQLEKCKKTAKIRTFEPRFQKNGSTFSQSFKSATRTRQDLSKIPLLNIKYSPRYHWEISKKLQLYTLLCLIVVKVILQFWNLLPPKAFYNESPTLWKSDIFDHPPILLSIPYIRVFNFEKQNLSSCPLRASIE